ncbi:MAG: TatD family hydrolase [Candidatus Aenigmarchaeota archaeon]|nr:TatD family hydrolase [Candidatus Aenigmarchaeota archaeon]
MIDAHCHLEQKDYDKDRDEVISKCQKELKAIVTCCAHPKDFKKSMEIVKKHKGFIFLTAGFHPEFIAGFSKEKINEYLKEIEDNKKYLVGIGECGLDYHWVKDEKLRVEQEKLFVEHINLAKKLNLPLVIHSRDGEKECLEILKEQKAERVLLHFFSDKNLIPEVIESNYFVSINTAIFRSKNIKKIAKKIPIEKMMLETDSPWLGGGKRNTPVSVKRVAEKIAELRKIDFAEIDKITTENAEKFFNIAAFEQ